MPTFKNPFISHVSIKNFRNFLDVDVSLGHKQVIIGENNVGKTNFLRALQLILDKSLSDNDRQLSESDFHDSIQDPLLNGSEIEIVIQIQGYDHNAKLVAQFQDAVVSATPPTIQFKYKYSPVKDENGLIIRYKYEIFKGPREDKYFSNEDRSYIDLHVIKALRDVERELRANKSSPLYKLVKRLEIAAEDLEEISEKMKDAADGLLELDEIKYVNEIIQGQFKSLSGVQRDNQVNLRTFDIDIERLLYGIQAYIGIKERPVSELSLGLGNILYVAVMLLLLKDNTIKVILKKQKYEELVAKDGGDMLEELYEETNRGNYKLKEDIDNDDLNSLYTFMGQNSFQPQSFTILAVEEPEAHLHPVLQRLIYREVLHKSDTSVIFTSHSTFIASVSPLNSIVHIRTVGEGSAVFSTAKLAIDAKVQKDIERYLDAKRGELYFGKGVILVEGITEEYILPVTAQILETPLDNYGIIICNINSTNFSPYIQLLNSLSIPWIVITDGDYYEVVTENDEKTGKPKSIKKFHIMSTGAEPSYLGNKIIEKLVVELEFIAKDDIPEDFNEQDKIFNDLGFFIGRYTMEVDMMEKGGKPGLEVFKTVYGELIEGGQQMKDNFEELLEEEEFWDALNKIEKNISKGRFSQRLAAEIIPELIPDYVKSGIEQIIEKVSEDNE